MYGLRRLGGRSRNLTLLRALLQRSAALRIISVNSELLERSIPLQAASAVRRSSLALEQDCVSRKRRERLTNLTKLPEVEPRRRGIARTMQKSYVHRLKNT